MVFRIFLKEFGCVESASCHHHHLWSVSSVLVHTVLLNKLWTADGLMLFVQLG